MAGAACWRRIARRLRRMCSVKEPETAALRGTRPRGSDEEGGSVPGSGRVGEQVRNVLLADPAVELGAAQIGVTAPDVELVLERDSGEEKVPAGAGHGHQLV